MSVGVKSSHWQVAKRMQMSALYVWKTRSCVKLEKDIIVKNGKKTVTTVSFPFLRVDCEKYTKNVFWNYEIYKIMKKYIDKSCLQGNNVITLIKHFIKHKIK